MRKEKPGNKAWSGPRLRGASPSKSVHTVQVASCISTPTQGGKRWTSSNQHFLFQVWFPEEWEAFFYLAYWAGHLSICAKVPYTLAADLGIRALGGGRQLGSTGVPGTENLSPRGKRDPRTSLAQAPCSHTHCPSHPLHPLSCFLLGFRGRVSGLE